MLVRIAAVLVLIAGCDRAFGLERPDAVVTCPASFRTVAGSSYTRIDDLLTWHQAQTACEALQVQDSPGYTHLAVISSDEEFAAIKADLSVTSFWIGHSDIALEGAYIPVTRETTSWPLLTEPPWAGGQPNNLGGSQNCVHADGNGLLDDKDCITDMFRFVCECDLFQSTAPLPP